MPRRRTATRRRRRTPGDVAECPGEQSSAQGKGDLASRPLGERPGQAPESEGDLERPDQLVCDQRPAMTVVTDQEGDRVGDEERCRQEIEAKHPFALGLAAVNGRVVPLVNLPHPCEIGVSRSMLDQMVGVSCCRSFATGLVGASFLRTCPEANVVPRDQLRWYR